MYKLSVLAELSVWAPWLRNYIKPGLMGTLFRDIYQKTVAVQWFIDLSINLRLQTRINEPCDPAVNNYNECLAVGNLHQPATL